MSVKKSVSTFSFRITSRYILLALSQACSKLLKNYMLFSKKNLEYVPYRTEWHDTATIYEEYCTVLT